MRTLTNFEDVACQCHPECHAKIDNTNIPDWINHIALIN